MSDRASGAELAFQLLKARHQEILDMLRAAGQYIPHIRLAHKLTKNNENYEMAYDETCLRCRIDRATKD